MNRLAPLIALLAALSVLLSGVPQSAGGNAPRSGGLSIAIILPMNGTTLKGDVIVAGNASGPEGVALSVQLSVDGGPWYAAEGARDWSWLWSTYAFADGTHAITARVQGGGGEAVETARFTVRNRPAFDIREVFPPGDHIRLRPGETAGFSVRVETSYVGSLLYGWYLDGAPAQSGGADWYNYTARSGEMGNHSVEVRIFAAGTVEASHSWNLSVRAWALPPVIFGFGPSERDITVYPGDSVAFNVSASDPQGRGLNYTWSIDVSPPAANVTKSSLILTFNSTGAHVVEVVVSNGETNRTVRWNVTVEEAPVLGPLDVLPCATYLIIGLVLGVWYGRRTRGQGNDQGTGFRVEGSG